MAVLRHHDVEAARDKLFGDHLGYGFVIVDAKNFLANFSHAPACTGRHQAHAAATDLSANPNGGIHVEWAAAVNCEKNTADLTLITVVEGAGCGIPAGHDGEAHCASSPWRALVPPASGKGEVCQWLLNVSSAASTFR
jgi:hypothetical protein